jgi:hypothetical protein
MQYLIVCVCVCVCVFPIILECYSQVPPRGRGAVVWDWATLRTWKQGMSQVREPGDTLPHCLDGRQLQGSWRGQTQNHWEVLSSRELRLWGAPWPPPSVARSKPHHFCITAQSESSEPRPRALLYCSSLLPRAGWFSAGRGLQAPRPTGPVLSSLSSPPPSQNTKLCLLPPLSDALRGHNSAGTFATPSCTNWGDHML